MHAIRLRTLPLALSFVMHTTPALAAQPAPAIALVNVGVVSIDDGRVIPGQTVLVRGDRIATVAPTPDAAVPRDATVIDGSGRFVVPGLVDAHVHLATDMPWAPARAEFGDAPLYLAHGVTTVINLAGGPEQLEWRRRIENGALVGPTIYTSGPFINEPRVTTVDEVRREVELQIEHGYDLIKFHELPRTTSGLSRAAYDAMVASARERHVPIVGHAPNRLGLDVLLQARQPLAHLGNLWNAYFLPLQEGRLQLLAAAGALLVLAAVVAGHGAIALGRRVWSRPRQPSPRHVYLRRIAIAGLLVSLVMIAGLVLVLPGGPLFDSITIRIALTAAALPLGALAIVSAIRYVGLWTHGAVSISQRITPLAATAALLTLAWSLGTYWTPVAWRSTPAGLARVAGQLRDAGIPVQTTLVVYESLSPPERARLIADPFVDHLHPESRRRWRAISPSAPPGYALHRFAKQLARALHDAGVPLMAGTDAMGLPLVAPGVSLHRELELLVEAGLSPRDAIRAATIVPAMFLGREQEFGRIAAGQRADLLLVQSNPLEDLATLQQPLGVMTRGRWYERSRLDAMQAALRAR